MLSTRSRSSIELDLRSSQGEPTGNRNRSLPDQSGNPDGSEQHEAQFLEPTDGGASAWRVLLAAFVFEALFYGSASPSPMVSSKITMLSSLSSATNSLLSVVGSCATGIAFLGAPLMVPFVRRHPKHKVLMICVGWSLCILGLMAGSFANSLPTLIITQGVMYGVGFVIFYYPIISIVNEWWVARRGMAWGVIVSAGGVTGVAIPFIIEAMLNKYGYKITLRAVALALVVLTGPLIPFFKGRLPFSQQTAAESTDWSFMKKPVFWVYCASNIAQGFGFYFPALYLPSYATSIGLSSTQGALLLALVSVAQVFGQFTFGILSDGRLPLNLLAVISTVVAAIATLALWGLAQSLAPLVLFSLIYGFFGYGFAALRSRLGTAVTGEPTAALAIFSIFCCGQGIGNVLAGPISAALLSGALHPNSYGAVKYRMVVIFTGACMVASALSIGSLYLRPRRLRSV